ncbi:Hypothetical Protein NG00_00658 [Corynebacterium camporealensis]|uniref:Uncharacterized protein n=1 Tax=Corynebacterium camporealensis TaxID=161896 RepID=A0A0F6TA37_9CORY|nr:hypothetical protein [Corynebacterium camporealensis]AKE38706.1 hypothetical protein UL81_03650 [Corynebacterium camporealensis]AVH87985.1 Hypothetical Protein NG00_00658 [Corynebacterium camporealensis]
MDTNSQPVDDADLDDDTTQPRRPMLWIVAAIAVIAAVGAAFALFQQSSTPTEEAAEQPPATPENVAEEPEVEPAGGYVDTSAPVEMYIPSLDMHAGFESGPCRVKDGLIDPVTMDLACAYTSDDKPYSLPGSDAEDIVVLAGHTGAGVPGVFDDLYDGGADEHTVEIGDELLVRTVTSGDQWLSYRATDLHTPQKEVLAQSTEIWGSEPTPGRLLTISCVQPLNPFAPSLENAVVGWEYAGLVDVAA